MKALSKVSAVVLAVLLLLSLAACNSPKPSDTPAGSSTVQGTQASSEAAATEPAKKVKIILWERAKPSDQPGYEKLYALREQKFKEKYPNVEIEYKDPVAGTELRQEYDKALMAGNAPAVNGIFSYTDIPSRIANKTIADITTFVDGWQLKKENKVWTAFDEAISLDGKWYAVPNDYYLSGLTYNVPSLTAGGGDPGNLPKTWDEFTTLGQKLTDKSKPRFGIALMGMDWNAWEFTPWVWSAGGEMVTKNTDGTWKIGFSEDAGVDAAMLWHDMMWKYKMTQKDVLEDWNAFLDDIRSGRCVFGWLDPAQHYADAKTKYGAKDTDFGVIPLPGKDASVKPVAFSGGGVWTFSPKNDEDQMKAAWDYVQMVCYDEGYVLEENKLKIENSIFNGPYTVRTDLTDKVNELSPWPELWKKDAAELSKNAKAEPYCPHWNDVKNAISKPLQKIILKEDLTREECKKILEDVAESLYKEYPDTFKK